MPMTFAQIARRYPEVVSAGDAAAREAGAKVFFLFKVGRRVTFGLSREAYGRIEPFFSFVVR